MGEASRLGGSPTSVQCKDSVVKVSQLRQMHKELYEEWLENMQVQKILKRKKVMDPSDFKEQLGVVNACIGALQYSWDTELSRQSLKTRAGRLAMLGILVRAGDQSQDGLLDSAVIELFDESPEEFTKVLDRELGVLPNSKSPAGGTPGMKS